MLQWYFTIRGPPDTDFEGGMYHGQILLPAQYPYKPPNIIWLTPNGRFEVGKRICLSISAHHPEDWQPAWGVRTILEALISFMPAPANGAVGALDWTPAERQACAKESQRMRVQNARHLPEAYRTHLDEWIEEFPSLEKQQASMTQAAFSKEAQGALHFHNVVGTKDAEQAEEKKNREAAKAPAASTATQRTAARSKPAKASKIRTAVKSVAMPPVDHLSEALHFFAIALVIVIVALVAKKVLS